MDADAYDALMRRLDALEARQTERRLARIEQGLDTLSTIMLDLAATTDKLEDQLLRFIARQREITTRQDAMNARLERTLDAITDLLRERRNGDSQEGR